jgi:hypothetical protein
MQRKVYLVIGLLALAGCDQLKPAQKQEGQSSAREALGVPSVGRYTIIHSPQVERDTMLLDTVTGDAWQLVSMGKTDDAGMGWQFVGKIDQPPKWEDLSPTPPKQAAPPHQ